MNESIVAMINPKGNHHRLSPALRALITIFLVQLAISVKPISYALCAETQGECYAVIVQNIGPGLAEDFRELLIEQGSFKERNILCYGSDEPFADFCLGPPTAEEFSDGMAEIAGRISEDGILVILFACHMQKGYLINNTLSYEELNRLLMGLPESATVAVIIEGCYAGAAIPLLQSSDLVYASAGPNEPCYGGWFRFFLDALGKDKGAYALADVDGNGFISFGEAYDYASDEGRLAQWYSALPHDVWPPADFFPRPVRNQTAFQYWFFLNRYAPAPF